MSDDALLGCCIVCGERDCKVDHEDGDVTDDDSWFFDGSGMVGDE